MKVIPSEYLLLAAVVEVAVRAVTSPDLMLIRWRTRLLVSFRLWVITLALTEYGKFISVYDYTQKLSCSLTIFHRVFVLLLSCNCN